MCNTFFIRGTIVISVGADKPTIYITPCAGFLTPDKPSKAIAYPTDFVNVTCAKLITLTDGDRFECDATKITAYLHTLVTLAAQQKTVEIRLDITAPEKSATDFKIIGFVFPVPHNHADRS